MRVLLLHGNAEWYGSDRSLVVLADALQRAGVEVTVGVPSEGALAAAVRRAGVDVVVTTPGAFRPLVVGPLGIVRYLLLELPRSVLAVRRLARRADVVHLNISTLIGGLVGARLARRPVVLHVRESYAGRERAWRAYCRLVRPLITRAIAISNDVATELRDAGLGDRTVVVHNGLPFAALAPPTAREGGPVVAVGRINDWKGQDVLVEAVAVLRERGVRVPVEIAGDALPEQRHLEDALRALAAERGVRDDVRLLGYVDDVPSLLARASIFVLPSKRPEPFGLALLDAMAHGLPCIATDAGGPRDMIDHGRTGLLTPMGDPVALADAIERLWNDPDLRARLGAAAAADVRARFSIERTAADVVSVYEAALASTS